MKLKSIYILIASFVLILTSALYSIPHTNAVSTKTFPDVESLAKDPNSKNYNYELEMKNAIKNLTEREEKVLNGYDDGNFRPKNNVSRAEAAVMIAKALKIPTDNVQDPKFKDVYKNDWFYPHVAALANLKYINGVGNGNFNPKAEINRQDMAKILALAFDLKASSNTTIPFTDNIASYAIEPVKALYEHEITKGESETEFGATKNIKRGDLALFITRAEKAKNSTPTNAGTSYTFTASKQQFKSITNYETDSSNVYSVSGISNNQFTIKPLNEGQGKLIVKGTSSDGKATESFYLVNVDKVNGQLVISLEKAIMEDYLDYRTHYYSFLDLGINFSPTTYKIELNGVEVDQYASVTINDNNGFDIVVYKEGQYKLTFYKQKQMKTLTVTAKRSNFEIRIDDIK